MEQATAFVLVAVFASQLILVLVIPFVVLRRILEARPNHAAGPARPAAGTVVQPPLLPMPVNAWLASNRLYDIGPALAQRADDNRPAFTPSR